MQALADAERTRHPTVVHVTHWKAGSMWMDSILENCCAARMVGPLPGQGNLRDEHGQLRPEAIVPGHVYPRAYLTREELEAVGVPAGAHTFLVIRDLRDVLVSAYYSLMVSHPTGEFPEVARAREHLVSMGTELGLLATLDSGMVAGSAAIQRSWLGSGITVVRYEELLERDVEILESVLLGECELPLSRTELREAVVAARFERLTGGRRRGEEDVAAHQRKGVAGDWRNHFTPAVERAFKERFGDLLIATGYAADTDW
jgi:hypothetical protein